MPFRIIIAGSRDFDNFELLTKACDKLILPYEQKHKKIEIISGTAKGADTLGERYAELRNYYCVCMPAQWDQYGKAAGYKRNQEMARVANAAIVFHNGQSKGAKHMINIAKKARLPIAVINYDPK